MTDKPRYDLVQAVAEKGRASGAKPIRIVGTEYTGEHFAGVDFARPGSDLTVVRRLIMGGERLRIEVVEPRDYYFFMGDPAPVPVAPLSMLRKSQRSTQRRLRFERNKANRLRDARRRRQVKKYEQVLTFDQRWHSPRRRPLNPVHVENLLAKRIEELALQAMLTGKSGSTP